MSTKTGLVCAAVALSLLAAMPIRAGVIVYGDPADVGNQIWDGSLAEDFTVNSPTVVSALAVYESGQTGLVGPLSVAIFASDGTQETPTLTFTSATTGTTLIGGDLFLSLATPVTLAAGNYSLTTAGWGPNDLDGNANCVGTTGCGTSGGPFTAPSLNTDGGAITFTGVGYLASGGLQYLAPSGSLPADQFNIGSLEVGAPEPAPTASLALGLLFLLIPVVRRQLATR